MVFYLGTHNVHHAIHFDRCFISVNRLRRRVSDFLVNDWILDSGAFSQLAQYGAYQHDVSEYAKDIVRWNSCGNLEMAVTQDYMCEPVILGRTGLTVQDHQELTIDRYDALIALVGCVPIMPVLQGYLPSDYERHLEMYGERLGIGMRVGIGSICRRNRNILEIVPIFEAVRKRRADLKLHAFGLKLTALASSYVCSLLYSADSMAWSYGARRNGRDANALSEAISFCQQIEETCGSKPYQLLLDGIARECYWWHDSNRCIAARVQEFRIR